MHPNPDAIRRLNAGVLAALALSLFSVATPRAVSQQKETLLERMDEARLRGMRRASRELRLKAIPSDHSGPYLDIRAVMHAHSRLSHDSRGTPEEIAAAAKAAGVKAVFMSDHPQEDRRWWSEGMQGERDGVLFIRGAELSAGLLIWRSDGTNWKPSNTAAEVLTALQGTPGVGFIGHPEGRKTDADWELPPFAGMEIYNTHADAVDNEYESLLKAFRGGNIGKTLAFLNTLKKYPAESFAAIFDEQTDVLARWDGLNRKFLDTPRRVVGIAANDAHQNVGISIEAAETELLVKDGLGEVTGKLPKKSVPVLLFGALAPGRVLLSHQFDPYRVSYGYVNTHLLADAFTEEALFDALLKGRAYIGFDWIADTSGFDYHAEIGAERVAMGGEASAHKLPILVARANAPCSLRLVRNGELFRETEDPELRIQINEPGVYRVEAWVPFGETRRPWIYSNPIYVR